MNSRLAVIPTAAAAVIVFAVGAAFYDRPAPSAAAPSALEDSGLVRFHSPVIGPQGAPVTIVEFFDPSCESCRAFYPHVKDILAKFPEDVRLVLRYTAFHEGSDVAVAMLEAARRQQV